MFMSLTENALLHRGFDAVLQVRTRTRQSRGVCTVLTPLQSRGFTEMHRENRDGQRLDMPYGSFGSLPLKP